jgi:hypothetical protein
MTLTLHSHLEWHNLAYSSIQILLDVCLAAHLSEFFGWATEKSIGYCHPGKVGGTPV